MKAAHSSLSDSAERSTSAGLQIDRAGQIHFWLGGSIWVGRSSGQTDWHDHHALQIAVALDGVCSFRSPLDGAWSEFAGALVQSHRPHQFECRGAMVAQLFVEPETEQGRALLARFKGVDIVRLPEADHAAVVRVLGPACCIGAEPSALIRAARAAIDLLANTNSNTNSNTESNTESNKVDSRDIVDTRIQKAIEYVRAHVRDGVTMTEAAKVAALSPSRFRHLFLEQTGSAFRVYALWMRLNVAVETAIAGQSWTEAAHQAGFTDSAHLTRTFKRMFGINPASLALDMRIR